MCDDACGVGPDYQLPDTLWVQMVRVLPPPTVRKQEGRPRMDEGHAMTVMLSVVRTGGPWTALPRRLGAPSTGHDRCQEWREAHVFARRWQAGVLTDETLNGLEWAWQALDGVMTKAPLGGETGGPNPDRSRHARDHTARADGRPGPAARRRRGRRPLP
jgi:putative transposase